MRIATLVSPYFIEAINTVSLTKKICKPIKSFNSVWHISDDTVTNFYKKWGCLPDKIFRYFSLQIQKVALNGQFSSWKIVQSEVPHVLVLVLLLFLIYINDLPDHIKSICKIFADYKSFPQFVGKTFPRMNCTLNSKL